MLSPQKTRPGKGKRGFVDLLFKLFLVPHYYYRFIFFFLFFLLDVFYCLMYSSIIWLTYLNRKLILKRSSNDIDCKKWTCEILCFVNTFLNDKGQVFKYLKFWLSFWLAFLLNFTTSRYIFFCSLSLLLFVDSPRPVLITDVLPNMKAMNWSKKFFLDKYGEDRITIKGVKVKT